MGMTLGAFLGRTVVYQPEAISVAVDVRLRQQVWRSGPIFLAWTLAGLLSLAMPKLVGIGALALLVSGGAGIAWVMLYQRTRGFTLADRGQLQLLSFLGVLGVVLRILGVVLLGIAVAVVVVVALVTFCIGIAGLAALFGGLAAGGGNR